MRAAAAILLILIPGAAMAQTATPDRSLQIVATAPSLCRMAPPSAAGDAVFTAEGGGGVLQLTDFVDDMASLPAVLPNSRSTALSSISSPIGVDVPWALT